MSSTPKHNSDHSDARKSEGAESGHQGVKRRKLVKGALVAAPWFSRYPPARRVRRARIPQAPADNTDFPPPFP